MNDSVLIKGYKDGLKILVTRTITYDEFLDGLKSVFSNRCSFFRNAHIALAIEGIQLTEKQELQVIGLIEELTKMQILCLIDDSDIHNSRFEKALRTQDYLKRNQSGFYLNGNVSSGQIFESEQSIVILGNIEVGAKVYSSANIIVIGGIYGYVGAGIDNNENAYIVALDMNPKEIRINQTTAHCAEVMKKIRQRGPKIAYLTKDRIFIDSITNF